MLRPAKSLEQALGHLSLERQELIKTTFRLQSFKVDIKHHPDGSVNLLCASLEGKPLSFATQAVKLHAGNYEEHRILLVARIVFEVVALLLNLVGIKATVNEEEMDEALKLISTILSAHSAIWGDVDDMIAAAKNDDMTGVAKAILSCLIDLFTIVGTPILSIVKIILQDMSWFDWIISVAQVSAFLASLVLTGGAALLVEVISWLLSATSFLKKCLQMDEFQLLKTNKKIS